MLLVSLLWLLFAGSHIGLAAFKQPISERVGPRVFYWGFAVVAAATFSLLSVGYASVRDSGPPGLALAEVEWARTALLVIAAMGVVLMVGALAPSGYWQAPISVDVTEVRQAVGLERITRHPFFTGTILTMGAHALLATRVTGTIFFSGFVLLIALGARHQAKKLRQQKGEELARYYETTSAIPFAAILRGKQRLVLGEIPWLALLLGLFAAYGLRHVHAKIFAWHGAPLAIAVGGGGFVIGVIGTWLQSRRYAAQSSREPALSESPK